MLSAVSGSLQRWNVRVLLWLVFVLVVMVAIYSVAFHEIMAAEGQFHSWTTSVYWTLVTMSTLGFGDVTFQEDPGRLFSLLVLISGALFILVLLPFAFIQFAVIPWMNAREAARAPRSLPPDTRDHLVITRLDALGEALVERADAAGVPWVLLVARLEEALALHDRGHRVMVGELDDPRTWEACRVDQAALVATSQPDTTNTNIAFTIRELIQDVPIVATADATASVDVLELAGVTEVLHLGATLGRALARRVIGATTNSHVVGTFGDLLIAEAGVDGTDLPGRTLRESKLRSRCSVNVIGMWHRGHLELATPDAEVTDETVLILAGSRAQLDDYDSQFDRGDAPDAHVLILGGGRVGRAAGAALAAAGIHHVIVEERADRIRDDGNYVHGDAAELAVLEQAGLEDATAVLVTTQEDDMNVYLTLYMRRLRPDVQVIARASADRNVSTLHRAGADAVLSYASLGATIIFNLLGGDDTLLLAEGLEVSEKPMPARLAGRSLVDADVARRTGCNVVAVQDNGEMTVNPDPNSPLPAGGRLVVIGDDDAKARFRELFPLPPP